MLKFHVVVSIALLVIIPAILLAIVAGLGVGLIFGSLNVHYRDIGQMSGMLLQLWMYATPVVYPLSLVERRAPFVAKLLMFNPATGIVELVRWGLFPSTLYPATSVLCCALTSSLLLIAGLLIFRRMERTFADIV